MCETWKQLVWRATINKWDADKYEEMCLLHYSNTLIYRYELWRMSWKWDVDILWSLSVFWLLFLILRYLYSSRWEATGASCIWMAFKDNSDLPFLFSRGHFRLWCGLIKPLNVLKLRRSKIHLNLLSFPWKAWKGERTRSPLPPSLSPSLSTAEEKSHKSINSAAGDWRSFSKENIWQCHDLNGSIF